MEKREDTPERIVRRRYEETHKAERKEKYKVWGTSIERKVAEDIDSFLEQHKLNKGDLIAAGFEALKKRYEPSKKDTKAEGNICGRRAI